MHFKVAAGEAHTGRRLFQDFGIDSLQALDLLTRTEHHFGIELPDYELQGVSDFRTLAERIQSGCSSFSPRTHGDTGENLFNFFWFPFLCSRRPAKLRSDNSLFSGSVSPW